MDYARIKAASTAYPKPVNVELSYGTAGFRTKADVLESTVFRCGLLTACRSRVLGQHMGIMITASHNPEPDNGVKIVEPTGEMLPQSLEPLATTLANCSMDDAVIDTLKQLETATMVSTSSTGTPLAVLVGYDTRPSAIKLRRAVIAGIEAAGVAAIDCGFVTTPQLHFLVYTYNLSELQQPAVSLYYDTLISAFHSMPTKEGAVSSPLIVDCAHGVGAQHLEKVQELLATSGNASIPLQLRNTGGAPLNYLVGADFVQKEKVLPKGFDDITPTDRCCSIDGDADRLVYFFVDQAADAVSGTRRVHLLDGDRIAILVAVYIRDLLDQLPNDLKQGLQVQIVQTAYANGASTDYITQELGLQVVCTPTGVKYLHAAAHGADVGIYFEANGHGTVLFSHALVSKLDKVQHELPAARTLLLLSKLINQTVGDAISNVLLVEYILRDKGWGLRDWQSLYHDLPSVQRKVQVADRFAITTTDAERKCVTPTGLQDEIDQLVHEYARGRAFVRPSGTEDAVRVYAEAASQQHADELATKICHLVYDLAGGVGKRP